MSQVEFTKKPVKKGKLKDPREASSTIKMAHAIGLVGVQHETSEAPKKKKFEGTFIVIDSDTLK